MITDLEATGSPELRADLSHLIACYYRDVGMLSQCEQFARWAIAAERQTGRLSLLGNHLMFLVRLLEQRGEYGGALELAEEALNCYQSTLGAEHRETQRQARVVAQIARRSRGVDG